MENIDILKKHIESNESTFHEWGDGWEGWPALDAAINEMCKCARKSRIFVYDKEKYGTYRCDVLGMYDGTLRWLLGKYSIRVENHWYDKVDRFIAKGLDKIGFVGLVQKLQVWNYNRLAQKVFLKYPSVINELISDNDLYGIIKPGRFGIVDGIQIHNKYWMEVKI